MLNKLSIDRSIPTYENTLRIQRNIYAKMEVYELHRKIELNPECELVGVKTYCLVYNNITNQPLTCTKCGGIKQSDVPIIHECIINQPSIIRTYSYELNNNTWNTIEWDVDNGYLNEEGFKMDQTNKYIEQSCLSSRMAGTGKSNIL